MMAAAEPHMKRREACDWTRFEPKDANNNAISGDEYLRLHVGVDLTAKGKPQSGKTYYRCKHITRFGCRCRMRSYKSNTTGETILEECGMHEHNHSTEKFIDGIPHRYKEKINESLKLHYKFKPTEIYEHIQDEFNAMLNSEERSKIKSYINRNRNSFKNICIDDTVSGIRNFCINNEHVHALGDDDIFVANHEVSPSRTNIVMTSRNMLKHLKYEDLVLAVDST